MKLAARTIAESVRKQPWCKDLPRKEAKLSERTVECAGDLAGMLEEKDAPKEKLTVEQVSLDGRAVGDDRDSPVVLMGDSHTVVYHEPISGGISAERAGLPDHLGAALGFAVDMTGSLGGGANVSRIYLAQRKDNLAGKKCLVWCFAVREFTESGQGWMKVPVVR
jgi:alginate O-acetyltransferase complex protein AlgJ